MAGRRDKERQRRDDETSQEPREDWIHVDAGRTEGPQLLDRNLHPDYMYVDRRDITSDDRAVDYVAGRVQNMTLQVTEGYRPDHYPPSFDSSAPTDNTVKDDITMRPPTPTWGIELLTVPNMERFNQAQYPNTVADWVTAPGYIINSIPKKESHTTKRSFVSNSSTRSHADLASTAANDGIFAAGALFNDVPAYPNYPQDIALAYPAEYRDGNGPLVIDNDFHRG